MSKYAPQINDFKYGEWSPLMYGRTDLEIYSKGCETLENMLVYPYGGAFRRPGTYYVVPTKYQAKKSRLVPFQFSVDDNYVLEFGDKYIRFFKDDGQIVYTLGDVDDFDNTDNYVVGDYVQHGNYIDIDCGNGRHIYFSKPENAPADSGIELDKSVEITTAADDNLAVSSADNLKVEIALAKDTPAKNASDLIEAAVQALGSPFDDWLVTENPTFIVGNIAKTTSLGAEFDTTTFGTAEGWWKFNEAGGNAIDYSGNSRDLTAGTAAQDETYPPRIWDSSRGNDFSAQFVTTNADIWNVAKLANGTKATFFSRFRIRAGQDGGPLFGTYDDPGGVPNAGWRLSVSTTSINFAWTATNYKTISHTVEQERWYDLCAVIDMDAKTCAIYLDNVLIGTMTSIGVPNAYSGKFWVGAYRHAGTPSAETWKGLLSDIAIFDGTLTTNQIATLTPGLPSASTTEITTTDAFKAFDGDDDTGWTAERYTTTGWIQYAFETAKTITDYRITAPTDETRSPEDWTLEGSNTGDFAGEEDVVDTVVGAGFTSGEQQEFSCDDPDSYKYYRLVVTDNGGNSDWLTINTLEMSEDGFAASSSEAAQEIIEGAGSVAETSPTADTSVYRCTTSFDAAAGNTSYFPAGEPTYWEDEDAYEVVTPYLEADLFDLQFAQSNDVMYIAHEDYPPMKLSRYGDTDWTIEEVDFTYGPWLEENLTTITMTPNATTGTGKTMTASAAYWNEGHVGSLFRYDTGDADCGYVKITSITSSTVAVCDIIEELSGTGAKVEWAEGAWNDNNGYPGSVTFFEQRLFWGGSTKEPQTVWGSQSESYENHQPGADDDDAVNYTLASEQMNAIEWLISSGKGIAIGTAGGTFTMTGGGEPLSPTNVQATKDVSFGANKVAPKRIGNYAYYVERNDRTVREYQYSFETDGYTAKDMTVLAEHVTESGIVDMDYQQSPYSMLWAVRDDGELAVFTRQIEEKVQAWSRITTDGEFESVACIPNGEEDQVWVVAKREIEGSTVRYVEYFKPIKSPSEITDSYFVDCGLLYDGVPATSFTGLTNLAGETVDVLADGVVVTGVTVSALGAFTLDTAASIVAVGMPYTSDLLTLNLEGGSNIGTSQGMHKRIWKATVRAYNTITCTMGADGQLDEVEFDDSELVTGDKEITFPKGWDKKGQINIQQTEPLPLVVLGVYPRVSVNEG